MPSVSPVEQALNYSLEARATGLARQTGGIRRHRKFSGADLVQTVVFGWLSDPEARLETVTSLAAPREIQVTATAVHKRFSTPCAQVLHVLLEALVSVSIEASQDVPLDRLKRFESVVLEESSRLALPAVLAELGQGCGGAPGGEAALKVHRRWALTCGGLRGPGVTSGRTSDHLSPFNAEALPAGSLYIADLGYVRWARRGARRAAGSDTVTRAPARTLFWTPEGKGVKLETLLPHQVGQPREWWVRVGDDDRLLMRLRRRRVPADVAERRRANLLAEAARRQRVVSAQALALADWTRLLTAVPANRLTLQEALVLLRERWQIEWRCKLWKQDGRLDEWRTTTPWRILCEIYAKQIGLLLQHWLIVLFAWQDEQRSLVKLAHVVRATCGTLLEALAGQRSLYSALQGIHRRRRSGCQMNTRKQHPNSAQLLQRGATNWALSP